MARKKTAGRPSPYEFKSLKLVGSDRPAQSVTIENRGQGLQAAQQEAKRKLEEQFAAEDAAKAAAEAAEVERAESALEAEAVDDIPELAAAGEVLRAAPQIAAPAQSVDTTPEPATGAPDPIQLAQMATSLSATLAQAMALEERLQRLNAESETRLAAAEAKEAKAEQAMAAAIAVTENARMIQNSLSTSTAENIQKLQDANNKAQKTIGTLSTEVESSREIVRSAARFTNDVREEVVSLASSEFSRVEEGLRLDVAILGGAVGVDNSVKELYMAKVAQDPTLGSKLLITDTDRARLTAAMARTTAADEASDLSSRTAADLMGASKENGGGTVADQRGKKR